jgi:hypothetical protein
MNRRKIKCNVENKYNGAIIKNVMISPRIGAFNFIKMSLKVIDNSLFIK